MSAQKRRPQLSGEEYRHAGGRYLFPLLKESDAVLFGSVRNNVAQNLKAIGRLIGLPNLTFSMNISTFRHLASGVNISEMLLGRGKAI